MSTKSCPRTLHFTSTFPRLLLEGLPLSLSEVNKLRLKSLGLIILTPRPKNQLWIVGRLLLLKGRLRPKVLPPQKRHKFQSALSNKRLPRISEGEEIAVGVEHHQSLLVRTLENILKGLMNLLYCGHTKGKMPN